MSWVKFVSLKIASMPSQSSGMSNKLGSWPVGEVSVEIVPHSSFRATSDREKCSASMKVRLWSEVSAMWMKKVQRTRVRPARTTWLTDEDDGVFVRTTPLTLCDVLSHNAQCNKHGKIRV